MSILTSTAGFFVGNWQRLVIYGLLILGALSAAAGWGYHRGVKKLWDYQAEQAKMAVKVVVKQGEVTERVVIRYLKVQGATRTVTETVEKEVVRYVETNPGHCLDARWRGLHDAAAANTLPPPAGKSDGTGGAPTAAEALEAVTNSYAACHRTADKLTALQEWIIEQEKVRP